MNPSLRMEIARTIIHALPMIDARMVFAEDLLSFVLLPPMFANQLLANTESV